MAPSPRRTSPEPDITPRAAAILIPLYSNDSQISIIMIRRQQHMNHHAGEIAFPGGACEPEDATLLHTALREAHEEIGLPPTNVTALGQLTPLYIAPSRSIVYPQVGWIESLPPLSAAPGEVAEILHISLNRLWQPENRRRQTWLRNTGPLDVPFFQIDDTSIWGATAMMLNELLVLIQAFGERIPA